MGRPKEHGEEMRERLLEAAGRLLAEEGAGAVSVRRLADEVGTSTRAIYSLFGSKDGLLTAMFRQGADTFVRLHDAVPVQDNPLDELLPLGLAYRQSALEQPNLYGLLFGHAVPGFAPSEDDIRYAQRSQFRVVDALERAVRQGLIRGDPWEISNQGWGLVHGLASLELMGCLGPPEIAEATWRGALTTMEAGLRRISAEAISS
jgi:AcrR family transcriptional regulator